MKFNMLMSALVLGSVSACSEDLKKEEVVLIHDSRVKALSEKSLLDDKVRQEFVVTQLNFTLIVDDQKISVPSAYSLLKGKQNVDQLKDGENTRRLTKCLKEYLPDKATIDITNIEKLQLTKPLSFKDVKTISEITNSLYSLNTILAWYCIESNQYKLGSEYLKNALKLNIILIKSDDDNASYRAMTNDRRYLVELLLKLREVKIEMPISLQKDIQKVDYKMIFVDFLKKRSRYDYYYKPLFQKNGVFYKDEIHLLRVNYATNLIQNVLSLSNTTLVEKFEEKQEEKLSALDVRVGNEQMKKDDLLSYKIMKDVDVIVKKFFR